MRAQMGGNWIATAVRGAESGEAEVFDLSPRRANAWHAAALLIMFMLVLLAGQSALGARLRHPRPAHVSSRSVGRTKTRPAQARLVTVSRRSKSRRTRSKRTAKAPAVSRAQMELAQQMVRNAYNLGEQLNTRQRVALLSRLLYTMRPEVMSAEKRQWAEELFLLAQRLPGDEAFSATLTVPRTSEPNLNGAPVPSQQMQSLRDQGIATAAARLALYDIDRALALLDTLPSRHGRREDARTMAARLVFATYMQRHGATGAQTLLEHAKQWGEHGGFPYGASAAALARLNANDAAEDYFRQELAEFERGQEGAFGIAEFAGLLERAVAMEAISELTAEEAGNEVVRQAAKLAPQARDGASEAGSATPAELTGGQASAASMNHEPLSQEAQQRLAHALSDVRAAAPTVYTQAAQQWPGLLRFRQVHMVSPVEDLKVDSELQVSFGELAETIRLRGGPEALREVIARGLQRVNDRYKPGMCASCDQPDRQSWALVSLAAYGSPFSIASQLNAIADPFWRAYFLAIAAQQVGEPTRVADPTARRVLVKEEAEPEEPDE